MNSAITTFHTLGCVYDEIGDLTILAWDNPDTPRGLNPPSLYLISVDSPFNYNRSWAAPA